MKVNCFDCKWNDNKHNINGALIELAIAIVNWLQAQGGSTYMYVGIYLEAKLLVCK